MEQSYSNDEIPVGFSKNDPNLTGKGGMAQQISRENHNQAILEQALTPDALTRLRRIKLVKEKNVLALENSIVSMAMAGKLPERISEGKLIEMLERQSQRTEAKNINKGTISIQRKKYALDSDDEDSDDDL